MNKISTNEGLEWITIDQSHLENLPIQSISFLANYGIQELNQVRLMKNFNSRWPRIVSFVVDSFFIESI